MPRPQQEEVSRTKCLPLIVSSSHLPSALSFCACPVGLFLSILNAMRTIFAYSLIDTRTRPHIHTYLYACMCVCVPHMAATTASAAPEARPPGKAPKVTCIPPDDTASQPFSNNVVVVAVCCSLCVVRCVLFVVC